MVDLLKKLERPAGKIRLVLDTDAFNEIDDQFAITYALKKQDRIQMEAIYAAPFFNRLSEGPKDGMEKSYQEIKKLLSLLDRENLKDRVYRGSEGYLIDEHTPQESEAARDLVKRANAMPVGEILYVAAIGAITNIASAIIMDPTIVDKIVLVWLGGHTYSWKNTKEFNLIQDVAAARVIFDSGVPLVQVPCMGVASHLIVTGPELREHIAGKNKEGDYLYQITCDIVAPKKKAVWSRVIWDVSTIMWLVGPEGCMTDHLTHSPIVSYEGYYGFDENRPLIKVVDGVNRDIIFEEMFTVIAGTGNKETK